MLRMPLYLVQKDRSAFLVIFKVGGHCVLIWSQNSFKNFTILFTMYSGHIYLAYSFHSSMAPSPQQSPHALSFLFTILSLCDLLCLITVSFMGFNEDFFFFKKWQLTNSYTTEEYGSQLPLQSLTACSSWGRSGSSWDTPVQGKASDVFPPLAAYIASSSPIKRVSGEEASGQL